MIDIAVFVFPRALPTTTTATSALILKMLWESISYFCRVCIYSDILFVSFSKVEHDMFFNISLSQNSELQRTLLHLCPEFPSLAETSSVKALVSFCTKMKMHHSTYLLAQPTSPRPLPAHRVTFPLQQPHIPASFIKCVSVGSSGWSRVNVASHSVFDILVSSFVLFFLSSLLHGEPRG